MENKFFDLSVDPQKGPLVAAAIHEGHEVRETLKDRFNLSSGERLREEDPRTGEMARQFDNHIIASRSRFEVDLNRAPDKAVYRKPEDAWGLNVWKDPLTDSEADESMRHYHHFYGEVDRSLTRIIDTYGFVIVYDIHSYNHRREGPDKPPADQKGNPDVDVLTTNIQMDKWRPVLDAFKQTLKDYPYPNGPLDVREEVRFDGKLSFFMQWVLRRFQGRAFVPSIEFKKIFMDEWTGKVDQDKLDHLKKALKQTESAVLEEVRASQKIPQTL